MRRRALLAGILATQALAACTRQPDPGKLISKAVDDTVRGFFRFVLVSMFVGVLVVMLWTLVVAGGLTACALAVRALLTPNRPRESAPSRADAREGLLSTVFGAAIVIAMAPVLLAPLQHSPLRIEGGPWLVAGFGVWLLLRGKHRLEARERGAK